MSSRVATINAFLERLPSQKCLVEPIAVDSGNAVLHVTAKVSEGDVLLVVPLDMCVTSKDLDGHSLSKRLPEEDSFSRLLMALLVMLHQSPDDPRSVYLANVVPPDHFADSMMACWPGVGIQAEWLSNSVAWRRARGMLFDLEHECLALAKDGFLVSKERFLWAKLLVQTRALNTRGDNGHVICPVFDMLNHTSNIPTARVRLTADSVLVEALEPLDPGDEVTWCYDPDADFLDLFERYGFFDESSIVHTAEVVVPRQFFFSEGDQQWRQTLIDEQMEKGCDGEYDAWWVPDCRIESSPLYLAVRASLITETEFDANESKALCKPIENETEVCARLAGLLECHLRRYSTSLAKDVLALSGAELRGNGNAIDISALRLLTFEKHLLQKQVEVLRAGDTSGYLSAVENPPLLSSRDDGVIQQRRRTRRCVIAPGNGCESIRDSNWYGWLYEQLMRQGLFDEVICRDFPDPYQAKRSVWLPFLRDELHVGADTVLIGHSSGAEAAMRLAAETPVGGLVLVSACHSDLNNENERASGYYPPSGGQWDWGAIRGNVDWIVQFHSRDDPLVPVDEGRFVAKELRSEYYELNGHSHFFRPFNQLLDVLIAKTSHVDAF